MDANAWAEEMSMPARMAATIPSHGFPETKVTIKAVTAPMAIMPSTPRFRMPDLSQMTSPMVPSKSGVPATSVRCATEMTISSMNSNLFGPPLQADAVFEEKFAHD